MYNILVLDNKVNQQRENDDNKICNYCNKDFPIYDVVMHPQRWNDGLDRLLLWRCTNAEDIFNTDDLGQRTTMTFKMPSQKERKF